MNLLPCGRVVEILAGGGPADGEVGKFLRESHYSHSRDGVSYVAIGVMPDGTCWLLTGPDSDELQERLREESATDAEILKLANLN